MKNMRKLMLSRMLCAILIVSFLVVGMPVAASAEDMSDGISSTSTYTVYQTPDEVRTAARNMYSEYSSVSVSASFSINNWIQSNNHRQTSLNQVFNQRYNSYYDFDIDNSCTEVSIAILTECMLDNGKISTTLPRSIDDIFARVVASAYDVGWDGSGTPRDLADEIMDENFAWYSPMWYTDYSTMWMESKMRNSFEDGVPVQISIDGHGVDALGFVTVTVTYQKTNWLGVTTTKTAEELFVVINDGWDNESADDLYAYSYVHFDDVVAIAVPE